MGNIMVSGYLVAQYGPHSEAMIPPPALPPVSGQSNRPSSDKVKGYGQLRVHGTCEAAGLEIYGNTTIIGYM
jgi:hypothetical protein